MERSVSLATNRLLCYHLPLLVKKIASILLNVLDVCCINQYEMFTDVSMHGQALFVITHHTLIPNWGNWLNREQILHLVKSARRVHLCE